MAQSPIPFDQLNFSLRKQMFLLLNNINHPALRTCLSEEQVQTLLDWRQFQMQYYLQNKLNLKPILSQRQSISITSQTIRYDNDFEDQKVLLIPIKIEVDLCKTEEDTSVGSEIVKKEEATSKLEVWPSKTPILQILHFLTERIGKACSNEMEIRKHLYASDTNLLKIYNVLVEKYSLHSKSREDMIRHILRKAFSYFTKCLRSRKKLTLRAALLTLCQRYSQNNMGTPKTGRTNRWEEERLLSSLLPYKKNSKYKTANINFIKKMFSSKEFHDDYMEFLTKLEEILETDNRQRTDQLVNFIVKCVEQNIIDKVKNYRRMPWLRLWLDTTQVVAQELNEIYGDSSTNRE